MSRRQEYAARRDLLADAGAISAYLNRAPLKWVSYQELARNLSSRFGIKRLSYVLGVMHHSGLLDREMVKGGRHRTSYYRSRSGSGALKAPGTGWDSRYDRRANDSEFAARQDEKWRKIAGNLRYEDAPYRPQALVKMVAPAERRGASSLVDR